VSISRLVGRHLFTRRNKLSPLDTVFRSKTVLRCSGPNKGALTLYLPCQVTVLIALYSFMGTKILSLTLLASTAAASDDAPHQEASVQAVASAHIISGEVARSNDRTSRLGQRSNIGNSATYALPLARSYSSRAKIANQEMDLVEFH